MVHTGPEPLAYQSFTARSPRQSIRGLVSLACGIWGLTFVGGVYVVVIPVRLGRLRIADYGPYKPLVVTLLLVTLAVLAAGLVFGVLGLLQPKRSRKAALGGLIMSVVALAMLAVTR